MQLIRHVPGLLLRPKQEWQTIAGEPTTPRDVALRYVLPLAAVATAATVAGLFRVGFWSHPVQGLWVIFWSIATGILMPLAVCAVTAIAVDGFAATFHGTPDRAQAFKLAGYALTPMLIAALVLRLWSHQSMLIVLYGSMFYAAYLLFAGIPILMRAPRDRTLPFALLTALTAWIAMRAVAVVVAALPPWGRFF